MQNQDQKLSNTQGKFEQEVMVMNLASNLVVDPRQAEQSQISLASEKFEIESHLVQQNNLQDETGLHVQFRETQEDYRNQQEIFDNQQEGNYEPLNEVHSETAQNHQYQTNQAQYQNQNIHDNAQILGIDNRDQTQSDVAGIPQTSENETQNFDQFNDVQPQNEETKNEVSNQQKEQQEQNIPNQQQPNYTLRNQQQAPTPTQLPQLQHTPQIQAPQPEVKMHQQIAVNSTQAEQVIVENPTNKIDNSVLNPFKDNHQNVVENMQKQQKPQSLNEQLQVGVQRQQKTKKKKSKKKKQQQAEPLPVITTDSDAGKKEKLSDRKIQQAPKKSSNSKPQDQNRRKPQENNQKGDDSNANQDRENNGPKIEEKIEKQEPIAKIQQKQEPISNISQVKPQVSEIIQPSSVSANIIIFEAQRQRIGSTLEYFIKFLTKHQKHTTNQKTLIKNVQDEVQKKRGAKLALSSVLKEYFQDFVSLSKDFYQKSYKFAKNDKIMNANPMINMKQELKAGFDELIFLRKATGNQFNRTGDFVTNSIQKNIVKAFADYWSAVSVAQDKHKVKKDEFLKKQKEFTKRIAKVQKVYTKGKQGVSQDEDLFIQMIKFINQEKDYKKHLTEYGLGLIPLKKAFIKAEQSLFEQLQVVFNTFKNQCRHLYCLHPKEFTQIQRFQKLVKQKNTFQKLSDITDSDYVRSVLVTLEKTSVQQLTDKQFEKVLNMLHFQEIAGKSIQLLKGTTSKSFELKNKAQQVVDTVSGNLLIFNKETAEMKDKFLIKNITAKIVQEGVIQIDQLIKGIIFDSNRTARITFRDNDRAEELICFLNQVHESIASNQNARKK